MVTARTKEEFESIWKEHIKACAMLSNSLPIQEAQEVLDLVRKLESYVPKAITFTYSDTKIPKKLLLPKEE